MKNRIFIGEFIGSAFLVMIIVGSGIMAQNLTRDFAVMLLANTLATGAGLFVLINSIFGLIRGAGGIEPPTSRTQSENHTPRPSTHTLFSFFVIRVGLEPT